jgi:hypothetical protein
MHKTISENILRVFKKPGLKGNREGNKEEAALEALRFLIEIAEKL